jgi:hypothetical protein
VFGFNQVGTNNANIISSTLTSGFSVDGTNQNLDGFGKFEYVITDSRDDPTSSFSFVVSRSGGFTSTAALVALSTDGSSSGGYGDFAAYLEETNCIPGENHGWTRDDPSAAPEPASIALFGSGLVSLAGLIRRRRKQISGS